MSSILQYLTSLHHVLFLFAKSSRKCTNTGNEASRFQRREKKEEKLHRAMSMDGGGNGGLGDKILSMLLSGDYMKIVRKRRVVETNMATTR
eukprot:scaffold4905_cov98-Cylindrotheca_fusiformis.AAC.2